ncbi:hypothetical protein L873DRAFT_1668129 [Choiromyces venosus 120613-1]|uniref:Ankyrin n=1 Tax=Choiromyces venosus 120613-1 TaxID=1336337 RepID=A0A3N4K079_9PEZI|nr:hypothetical protein L873DRAFT_1668129 [Choiromyces venosus 120613-1]
MNGAKHHSHGGDGVVKLLLEREDVNPDNLDEVGRTPLSYAAGNGHEGVVSARLDARRCQSIYTEHGTEFKSFPRYGAPAPEFRRVFNTNPARTARRHIAFLSSSISNLCRLLCGATSTQLLRLPPSLPETFSTYRGVLEGSLADSWFVGGFFFFCSSAV